MSARLRVCLVTDGHGDLPRIERVVAAVLEGGCLTIQLREPAWSARELWQACRRLRPHIDAAGGWLLVNDRVDVAATGVAHGAQVGHRSLPAAEARAVLGAAAVVGASVHDAAQLAGAAAARCTFALLAPVWPTSSKPGATALGLARAVEWTRCAALPVLWLGGVDAATAAQVRALPPGDRPAGLAARSALMDAADPAAVAAALRAAVD